MTHISGKSCTTLSTYLGEGAVGVGVHERKDVRGERAPTEIESRVLGGANGRWTLPVFCGRFWRCRSAWGDPLGPTTRTPASGRICIASASKSAELM